MSRTAPEPIADDESDASAAAAYHADMSWHAATPVSAGLSAAMARAFAQIEGAIKGKTNPAFRSKYADLAAVVDAVKPALAAHGLWFRQVLHRVDGGVCVETVIHHESGGELWCGPLYLPAAKQDPQGYGSALTYARRYSLMAAFGVPAEDDDGNAAAARQNAPQRDAPAPDVHRHIRDVADRCIALHAAAVVRAEKDADMSGFWDLHDAAAKVTGEDRVILWDMLKAHSAVRSSIKEYAGYAAAEKAKATA
jgi:hypothetical protein